jgi:hypothetical protein
MKCLPFCFFIFLFVGLQAQNTTCPKLKAGSIWQLENLNGKDKSLGKTTFKVSKVDSLNGKSIMRIVSITADIKGKQLKKVEIGQECRVDTLLIDMKTYLSLRDNASYKWRTDPAFISFPAVVETGQQLPKATIVYTAIKAPKIATQVGPTASKNDQTGTTVTFTIDARTVEAKEDITTPAGTFTCYRIKSRTVLDNRLDYASVEQEQIDWYAPGVGVIKSEAYRRGKKVSSSVLTVKKF